MWEEPPEETFHPPTWMFPGERGRVLPLKVPDEKEPDPDARGADEVFPDVPFPPVPVFPDSKSPDETAPRTIALRAEPANAVSISSRYGFTSA